MNTSSNKNLTKRRPFKITPKLECRAKLVKRLNKLNGFIVFGNCVIYKGLVDHLAQNLLD